MRKYRDLSEEQLEELVHSLPGRKPSPWLRARVLSQAVPRRRVLQPRVALALALLLLAADVLMMRRQDATLPAAPLAAAAQQAERVDADLADLLSDASGARARWQLALTAPNTRGDSYLRLRDRLLNVSGKG